MTGTALERLGLAGIVRATQISLDRRNARNGVNGCDFDEARASREVLDKLIEAEIIPRLMLVNREAAEGAAESVSSQTVSHSFTAEEVDHFARKAVTSDPETMVNEINALFREGVSHADVLLKLLAPAARRLGQLWDEDLCDFADVTIGLMKLHRVLQRVNADAPAGMGVGGSSPRILLAPAPGEQHIFGVVMVGEFFARSGWRVRCESKFDHLIPLVSEEHFDVVGYSASCTSNAKALASEIKRVRKASLNPAVFVMAGGPVFNEDVGFARRIGADATAADGVRAVVTAERMIHRLQRAE